MDIYFNKGKKNEEVVLESDILKMDKPTLKNLRLRCQATINDVSTKRDIFRTETDLPEKSQEYWRKMYVYKSVILKFTKAIAWLKSIEVNAKPAKQHEDREHWLWCYYQESMKVLTDEMSEQIKEMADLRAKFHCEIEKWEFKEAYMNIFCCTCKKDIDATLIYGDVCYPHRKDLSKLKFYQCPVCKNFVGTHKGTDKPLGVIASAAIKKERMKIHSLLDPLWKSKKYPRKELYRQLSSRLGYDYHTANLKSIEECHKVYSIVSDIAKEIIENE